MKKKNPKNNIALRSIIFITVLALILLFIYVNFRSQSSPASNGAQQTKRFESKDLKFSISLPTDFLIEEKFNSIFLKSNDGEITVGRIGTNFDNLNDYLDNLSSLNNFTIENKENLTINNYSAVKAYIKGATYYFIYPSKWVVYSIFTKSQPLFGDLDQIAQSFRYTP